MKQKTTKSSFLQKRRKHRLFLPARPGILIAILILLMSMDLMSMDPIRRVTVTYKSSDSLLITADQYISSVFNPYIILLHEQNSSRGEFEDIARRLCKMDYNCLAVDLRNGGTANFTSNETVKRCQESKCSTHYTDVENDILASISFIRGVSPHPVVLLGSGINGSLSLKLAKSENYIRAVVALSPGEYFLPDLSIQDTISGLLKPVFIASSQAEVPYMEDLVSGIGEEYKTVFQPQLGAGARGTTSLVSSYADNSEYWLALLLFFKDLI